MSFKKQIQEAVSKAVKSALDVDVAEVLVTPAPPEFGDFTTNVAFGLVRQVGKSPREVAAAIAAALPAELGATVAGAGYINLIMPESAWRAELATIDAGYGHTKAGAGQKVQVEFISANPTGPTTFGNARGGFIGDTIAQVLSSQGYDVTREYYFNDGGTQIQKLVESVRVAAGLIKVDEVQYKGEYIQQLATEFGDQIADLDQDAAAKLLTTTIVKRYIEPAVAKMNISFDVWFNERSLIDEGKVAAVLQLLDAKGLIYDKDGATWLASESLGDERDRVLRKSNGDLTYLANDIAYHYNIFVTRGFDRAIKDWGADHAGQVPSLKLVMAVLAPEAILDVVLHQWVRLMRDGKEVKMSKRAGTYVTVEEVIDEVGGDVARFFFLMRSADSAMDFDLDLAKDESQKNPLWYVMYSYVRAASIQRQATERGVALGKLGELSAAETAVVRQMAQWPELLSEISQDYSVHRLTFFGMQLATLFHAFYESTRVLDLPAAEAGSKLAFIQHYRHFMDGYFAMLGIKPVDHMSRSPQSTD